MAKLLAAGGWNLLVPQGCGIVWLETSVDPVPLVEKD